MTRIYALLFAVALTLNACATAGPIAIKCGLQDVSIAASDYAEIAADVHSKNWSDLAKIAETIGWATLDCVLGDQAAQDPAVKANVDEFRRLHSVEFRAAGGSACNSAGAGRGTTAFESRGERTLQGPPAETFSYAGETVAAAAARCDRACGERDAISSPGGECLCWRGPHDARGRWVAAR